MIIDFLGIVVGHLYYFLDYVYPQVAESRGWRRRKILVTPMILHYLFGSDDIMIGLHQTPVQTRVDGQRQRAGFGMAMNEVVAGQENLMEGHEDENAVEESDGGEPGGNDPRNEEHPHRD